MEKANVEVKGIESKKGREEEESKASQVATDPKWPKRIHQAEEKVRKLDSRIAKVEKGLRELKAKRADAVNELEQTKATAQSKMTEWAEKAKREFGSMFGNKQEE